MARANCLHGMPSLVRAIVCAGIVLAAAAATGCGAQYVRSAPLLPVRPLPTGSLTRNVVVVSIDGLRPDAIITYSAPTLQRLMREGSYTLSARTIDPSKTLPSHTSMLTGQPPDRHGVLWNNVASAGPVDRCCPRSLSAAKPSHADASCCTCGRLAGGRGPLMPTWRGLPRSAARH